MVINSEVEQRHFAGLISRRLRVRFPPSLQKNCFKMQEKTMNKLIIILSIILLTTTNCYSHSDMSDVIEPPEITVDLIGIFSGDLLVTFEPGIVFKKWNPHITGGFYYNTIAVGAGIGKDLEEKSEDKIFNIPVRHGFTADLSFILTFQDKFAGWFTPGIGYEFIADKQILFFKTIIIEPQLTANLGTTFFMSVSFNVGGAL